MFTGSRDGYKVINLHNDYHHPLGLFSFSLEPSLFQYDIFINVFRPELVPSHKHRVVCTLEAIPYFFKGLRQD